MEKHLIQEAKNGNRKSIEMLYKQFYGYAMSVALRYSNSREEACEIINDSFMKAFDKIGQYDNQNSFKGWLRRILINTSIDYYRKNIKHTAVMDIEKADTETLDPDIIDQLSADDILGVLRDLPEILRIIFNMYEIEGYSHNEISEQLGIPSSTSRTYLARAKKKLREKILELNQIKNAGAIR
ncbi:RNA polymerase sigma factor [Aquiflexum gelatinilyticum]|uniref:RNA polymerase sigma factor n=1 Tax=Aquiflexum gelatinilyticum TaxID=2961943 RepID=A0A9X2PE65_9BACT|nr:RNA polymerase sigma factor [Aquiflexum gelatinilyticum]MCR9017095.1 RNA polymerase sigma factor [Aquiflexum gelatinilyticum]MCS4434874.1 RNA polymerase sigma factor [Aquiflexum gelatinilyticum]